MDLEFILLNSAVFGAAALQSATGIGFGVIADPDVLAGGGNSDIFDVDVLELDSEPTGEPDG